MTSNHEEYSNDITLENLKCSVQINWSLRTFVEKVRKEFEVIKLALSNVLYNTSWNSTNALIVFLDVCYHQLCSPETGKKQSINFIMTFAHSSPKKE